MEYRFSSTHTFCIKLGRDSYILDKSVLEANSAVFSDCFEICDARVMQPQEMLLTMDPSSDNGKGFANWYRIVSDDRPRRDVIRHKLKSYPSVVGVYEVADFLQDNETLSTLEEHVLSSKSFTTPQKLHFNRKFNLSASNVDRILNDTLNPVYIGDWTSSDFFDIGVEYTERLVRLASVQAQLDTSLQRSKSCNEDGYEGKKYLFTSTRKRK